MGEYKSGGAPGEARLLLLSDVLALITNSIIIDWNDSEMFQLLKIELICVVWMVECWEWRGLQWSGGNHFVIPHSWAAVGVVVDSKFPILNDDGVAECFHWIVSRSVFWLWIWWQPIAESAHIFLPLLPPPAAPTLQTDQSPARTGFPGENI